MGVYAGFLLLGSFFIFTLREQIGDKYFFFIEFVLITISGVLAYSWKENFAIWDIFVSLGGGATLALSFLALLGYLDYIKQEDDIIINFKLENKDEPIPTGLSILRKHATRAELQGRLRILSDSKDYSIDSLMNVLKDLDNIQVSSVRSITIKITVKEIKIFKKMTNYEEVINSIG